jgi:hypothetical protein
MIILYILYMSVTSYINIKYYDKRYQVDSYFISISFYIAGICLYYTWRNVAPKRKWLIPVMISIGCVFTITSYTLFFVYLPKYTLEEAYTIIKQDPKFKYADISHNAVGYFINDNKNPFVEFDYTFEVKNDDNSIDRMFFDPVSGDYGVGNFK